MGSIGMTEMNLDLRQGVDTEALGKETGLKGQSLSNVLYQLKKTGEGFKPEKRNIQGRVARNCNNALNKM